MDFGLRTSDYNEMKLNLSIVLILLYFFGGCDTVNFDPIPQDETIKIRDVRTSCENGIPHLFVDFFVKGFAPWDVFEMDDPVGATNLWVGTGAKEDTWAIMYQISAKPGAKPNGSTYPYTLTRPIDGNTRFGIPVWQPGDQVEVEYLTFDEQGNLQVRYKDLDIPRC